ncbi:MAG: c-type cytochrome [Betaproteobacteria bacterium]|nr:c-type cytochrome [Betaproteobacteria bacterium]
MRRTLIPFALLFACHAHAANQPRAPGIETPGYVWNKADPETTKALLHKGDAARGKEAYRVCRGCHKQDGSGLVNGDYPQLAGQLSSVLIKQMADMRAGRRDNSKMHPFVGMDLVLTDDLADIAAFLNGLPPPPQIGKGDGKRLERGKELYKKDCAFCHGKNGEGNAKWFYPKVSQQHYRYLLRQIQEIREQGRRNSNPDMIEAAKDYSDRDLEAVSDYMSRLPEAQE